MTDSETIDAKIDSLPDWRGKALARVRELIRQADPQVIEEVKWRKPNGGTLGLGPDVGAHFPRGAPLVTAGGLVFVATAQDRQLRAYDRATGDVLWSYTLPGGSEGIPATYELDGRQYLAVPVAAGAGLFAPLLEPPPAAPPLERAYIVFALPRA
jgi:quinoprotein glucose dehydrogenase